jgi:cobaltochelatase CobN
MAGLRLFLLAGLLSLLTLLPQWPRAAEAGHASAGSAAPLRLLVIATPNVPPGKYRVLAEIAARHGVKLEVRYLNRIASDADGALWQGADAVLVDSYLHDQVRGHLARALPALTQPQLWLHADRMQQRGWPAPLAEQLNALWTSGGRANFEGFFARIGAHLAGRDPPAGLPAPVRFPKAAVYHPDAPATVFADVASAFAWRAPRPGQAVVAIALHQQYVSAMQTGFIDDLVRRIEAGGALALPIYAPMLEPGSIERLLAPDGKPLANVLLNTQIMLNAELRRGEFERLGLPVLQALPYRRGDEAAWAADPQGVPLTDIPFYMAQPEYAGAFDTQIAAATRKGDDELVAIGAQAQALVDKALRLAALQTRPNADKRVGVMFWNYPPGEKNFGASFLNVPRSLRGTLAALAAAGYRTTVPEEAELIALLQRTLEPFYRERRLDALLAADLAEAFPVARYRAWLERQPLAVQQELQARFGAPEASGMVLQRGGEAVFVVPRLKLGHVAVLPQPPRGERWDSREKAIYHNTREPPSHFYLAAYLWLRESQGPGFGADALVHFGTHGSQEWLPGKERGLAVADYPMLALGDLPVAYPYIADNIGEALQARRRGRAVIVSHQTPPFKPAGLHEALTRIHDLLHAWSTQDEGAVKQRLAADLLAAARRERIDRDMGWDDTRVRADFPGFVDALHHHLHELAETAQPLGLHTLGAAPAENHRLATVLLMLGKPFWEAAARHAGAPAGEVDEALVVDFEKLPAAAPYALLHRHVVQGEPAEGLPKDLAEAIARAREAYAALGADRELPALLAVLDGRHLATSYGGDPIKNPEAYPTGRNLYGFDPSRVPTPQAWAAGQAAAEQVIALHRQRTGQWPKKLALSLWSVETMRQQGLLEAQALALLGVQPLWDNGGRVVGVKLIERQTLRHPRVDVVLSATGLYRDHFPNVMKHLARAVELAAAAADDDNAVAANTRRLAAELQRQGVAAEAAGRAALTRLFSSESGRYGTGLDDAVLASDTWRGKAEGDRKLAQLYLARMQYAYGPDETQWGRADMAGAGTNLYAAHLKGTEGAVLSRASNTYGMLTTDDPFQYLGGIALAVRHLDGRAPELYIANARSKNPKLEDAAGFLAKEMATRQLHPGYIRGLMQEGHAGTLQVLDAVNNFWGWTAVAREIVRDDQWQELVEVYVRDKHKLGLAQWFQANNPHALAQTLERMLEAARQGYWAADRTTVAELKARWRAIATQHDVRSDNAAFRAFVGYGLDAPRAAATEPAAAAPPQTAPQAAPQPAPPEPVTPPPVRGLKLEPRPAPPEPSAGAAVVDALTRALALAFIAACMALGAWRARRSDAGHRPLNRTPFNPTWRTA